MKKILQKFFHRTRTLTKRYVHQKNIFKLIFFVSVPFIILATADTHRYYYLWSFLSIILAAKSNNYKCNYRFFLLTALFCMFPLPFLLNIEKSVTAFKLANICFLAFAGGIILLAYEYIFKRKKLEDLTEPELRVPSKIVRKSSIIIVLILFVYIGFLHFYGKNEGEMNHKFSRIEIINKSNSSELSRYIGDILTEKDYRNIAYEPNNFEPKEQEYSVVFYRGKNKELAYNVSRALPKPEKAVYLQRDDDMLTDIRLLVGEYQIPEKDLSEISVRIYSRNLTPKEREYYAQEFRNVNIDLWSYFNQSYDFPVIYYEENKYYEAKTIQGKYFPDAVLTKKEGQDQLVRYEEDILILIPKR